MIHAFVAGGLAAAVLALAGCSGNSEQSHVASARSALANKDTDTAFIYLRNAIAQNSDSADARFLLGKTLLETGDPVAAIVELRKAQELQSPEEQVAPELARAMMQLGEAAQVVAQFANLRLNDATASADVLTTVAVAHAALTDPQRALQAADLALRASPNHAPALVVKAKLAALEGRFDAALALLEDALAKEPDSERAGLLRGDVFILGKKDEAGALAAYRQLLAAKPKSIGGHSSVIALLYSQGKSQEARAQFDLLKKLAPNHPDALFYDAQFAFDDKQFARSREIAERLLKVAPNNPRVLELAGAAEYNLGHFKQAEFLLGKALKVSPALLRARHLLAKSYLSLNQPNKVIEVLQPALDGKVVDGASLSLAGAAWLQQGQFKKADAAFQAAAKLAPKDPAVLVASALSQISGGNEGAIASLEAVAADDTGSQADLALISARLAQKDFNGALKAIERLERKQPSQALPSNMRGRVLMLMGDHAAATKAFEAALLKDPNFFPAVASLAAIDIVNGKPDLARKRFEAATEARPNDFHAFLALAELSERSGGTPADVLKHLRAAVRASPDEAAPHLALVTKLLASGGSALEAAQAAVAALPNDLNILDALGQVQLAAGNGNQAVATFKMLAAQQPSNPMHQLRLADAHMATKDYGNASRALREALTIRPDMVQAQQRQVTLAVLEKRPQDGLLLAREMQKKNPQSALGYTLEGEIETSQRNWDGAIAAHRNALQRAAHTDTAINLHGALRRAKRGAEAERMAADWLKSKPKDAVFAYYLADVAMAANQVERAETLLRAVVQLQPKHTLALNNLAWLLAKQGKPGAVAAAEKANELSPDRPVLLDTLAMALASDNQLPKAIEVQQRALNLQPDDPVLMLGLARIYIKAGEKGKARSQLEGLAKLGDKFGGQAEVSQLLKTL